MEFSPEHLEYRFRKAESAYLVWLQGLNRYLQLEEPAFWVFKQFREGLSRQEMIRDCAHRYQLPETEAERFIGEIEHQFQILFQNHQKPEVPSVSLDSLPPRPNSPVERLIAVDDSTIRFSFGDPTIEQFIFPLFSHLEIPSNSGVCDLHLEVFNHKGNLYLIKNQERASKWVTAHAYKLKGALVLDVINLIHHTTEETWMGVIHASSVCRGNSAVMFPAQPGGGKSTLAALLIAHGCSLVSDDFTPVAMEDQHIYSFPGAISIKQGSMSLLKSYFPQLEGAPQSTKLSNGENVTYLAPLPLHIKAGGYPVSAIVFVQYDKQADCELEQVNNLDVINDFLKESWLADNGRAAEQFMDWYLEIPCYRLRYGNHEKAFESFQKLF